MATFGLGNFVYELVVKDGSANFHFVDPEDADNTADVSVPKADFEGFNASDRQVADIAYAQCSKVMNDRREKRIREEATAQLDAQLTEETRAREEAQDFLNNTQELANTTPTGTSDGTPKKAPETEDKTSHDDKSHKPNKSK